MSAIALLLLLLTFGLAVTLAIAVRRASKMQHQLAELSQQLSTAQADLSGAATTAARDRGAIAAAPLGIVIVDADGQQVHANDAAAGYTAAEVPDAVVGLRLRNLVADAIDSPLPKEQELQLFSPAPRKVRLRAEPLLDGSHRVGTAVFIEDLTTRSQVDSMRRDFIANASHELKTPIGALRLLAEAFVATNEQESQLQLAARMQEETARMTRLVDDILDLTLIEEGQQARDVVDLCAVTDQALEQTSLLSDTLGIPVRSSCEKATVLGDQRALVSAMANLIENAVIHTAEKGPGHAEPVEVRVGPRQEQAVIEIEDHGIGISERHRDRIFERFYRVDQGRSRASGGTGLGLAIVRHVVQNHLGEIEVESVPGRGSTFRITLPIAPETPT